MTESFYHKLSLLHIHDNIMSYHAYKAGKGTRTLDLLITNQLRYQLRYSSKSPTSFIIYGISCFGKSIFSFF